MMGSHDDKPHISTSQMETLAKCPARYEFRYVEGIKSPPGVAALIGSGTDRAVSADLENKILTGDLLETEAVEALAADATRAGWEADKPALDEDEKAQGEASVLGAAIDTAVSLSRLHHVDVAPGIAPLAVQERFRIELKGWPLDLVGIKDIRTANAIRDTKTSGKSPAEDAADKSIQLTAYHLDSTLRGAPPDFVALDFLVKAKTPKYVERRSTRTASDHNALLRRIEVASTAIRSGIFPPTDPTNWWCSAKWCGYYSRCAHGGRAAVSVPFGVVIIPAIEKPRAPSPWGDDDDAPAAPSAPQWQEAAAYPAEVKIEPQPTPQAAPAPDPDPMPDWATPRFGGEVTPELVVSVPAPVTTPTARKRAPRVAELSKALNDALGKK